MHSEIGAKVPQIAHLTTCGADVTLTFDFLTSTQNLIPNCTELINLVKFSQAVYKINTQTHKHVHRERQTDSFWPIILLARSA